MSPVTDFSVASPMTDLQLIVGGKRLHVNRAYLAVHSEKFRFMFMGKNIQKNDIVLEDAKYDEFVTLLKVIHPPHEEPTEKSYPFLIYLAEYYQLPIVFKYCDKFIKNDKDILLAKKLFLADTFKLPETKEWCMQQDMEEEERTMAMRLPLEPEYITNFTLPSPMADLVLVVEGKRLYVNRAYIAVHSEVIRAMLSGKLVDGFEEVTLKETKYDKVEALLKVIYPPHEEPTVKNYKFLLKLGERYQIAIVCKQCDKFLKNDEKVPAATKRELINKYNLPQTKYLITTDKKAQAMGK